jgi:hypothetical protein
MAPSDTADDLDKITQIRPGTAGWRRQELEWAGDLFDRNLSDAVARACRHARLDEAAKADLAELLVEWSREGVLDDDQVAQIVACFERCPIALEVAIEREADVVVDRAFGSDS